MFYCSSARRLVRKAEGRDAEPSACVLDAQSIKTSANVPAAGQGIDAGKIKFHLYDALHALCRHAGAARAAPGASTASAGGGEEDAEAGL